MKPLVSICLPNLNKRAYLPERLESIFEQTFSDWELIICDSYSNDGSWEYFQRYKTDKRVKMFQQPPGLYAAWNECMNRAEGEFVYIATSDDSSEPNALEVFLNALESNPSCGIAHCNLKIIDGKGRSIPDFLNKCFFKRYFGELLRQPNIRVAPHDGLLHLSGESVFLSVTALCFRTQLIHKYGNFLTDFGSQADFEWGMRMGLCNNVVHIPDTLATWRLHEDQATSFDQINHSDSKRIRLKMMEAALNSANKLGAIQYSRKKIRSLTGHHRLNILRQSLYEATGAGSRIARLLTAGIRDSATFVNYVNSRFSTFSSEIEYIQDIVRSELGNKGIVFPEDTVCVKRSS